MKSKVAYHMDLANTLPVGKLDLNRGSCTLNPTINQYIMREYPDGISRMGEIYLSYTMEDDAQKIISNAKEYIFESVRRLYFPTLPSRMQSLCVVDQPKDLEIWFSQLVPHTQLDVEEAIDRATVKTVCYDEDKSFVGDAMWRDYLVALNDGKKGYSSTFACEMAHYYWRGVQTDTPRPERLIQLPVNVVDSTPLREFACIHGLYLK